MTPADFKEWRRHLGYTLDDAAEALGIGRSTIARYERGTRYGDDRAIVIPHAVALAMAAIARGIPAWGNTPSDLDNAGCPPEK